MPKLFFDGEKHGKSGLRREGYHPFCISVVLALEEGLKAGKICVEIWQSFASSLFLSVLVLHSCHLLVKQVALRRCYLFPPETMGV